MPHTYDFFVASLRCPVCGEISPADQSTNMSTYLRDEPEMANLSVGDKIILDPESIRNGNYDDNGYLTVHAPKPGEAIRILQSWECPSCGSFNWAEIVVRDGVIESISAVPFDRVHFERSHLVSHDLVSVAADLTGEPARDLVTRDLVQLVREKLALTD